ncbi:sulfurtransferase-like selenium metabolism protein YedF [Candidatus Clostridium stratigraminis]|uniref:Sulfurtransferase-like selenium metabolism protein YedF n=1 Tax=Candidatus Clostridium stratigraminis TaxID=3381661 RepID=A0ABW8T7K6_9CLOT
MEIIDCRGLKCPQPVINTKKYFDAIESGDVQVIVDNEVAKKNISKFSESNNFKYTVEEKEGLYFIKIEKVRSIELKKVEGNNLVIVITSDKLGQGDDSLGSTLMKSYLYALAEADALPADIFFLNSGVKLAADGSEVLDSLLKLSKRGINIASCGICLDFYNLKEKLQVGEITNMYNIIEKMNGASNTIKL